MSQFPRPTSSLPNFMTKPITFPGFEDDDLVSTMIPLVTVVLEGRLICQRISLHKHANYHSLAKALKQMFVDGGNDSGGSTASLASESVSDHDLDLTNAGPGHLIAYEDIESDLLLASDLNWNSNACGHEFTLISCLALFIREGQTYLLAHVRTIPR
ncbi:hypothetical protein POTOM_025740 [Populus tomentosa]|uniref:Auxin-responsive protein n=1 Tax=Populus tomentosa TaxID=118781 RepID=A0A8X7ZPN7_POPTO|nr:hypothetical protein POTOM_025740 [Populus tomentosa]